MVHPAGRVLVDSLIIVSKSCVSNSISGFTYSLVVWPDLGPAV